MKAARDGVAGAAETAKGSGRVFHEIIDHADTIADMVRSIATASEEQSATSDEISSNVMDINSLSQDISRSIREANVSIQEVAGMAGELSRLVEHFKHNRRRLPRISLKAYGMKHYCKASLDGRIFSVELIDISPGGARVSAASADKVIAQQVEEGEVMNLEPNLPEHPDIPESMACVVRWKGEQEFGVEFEEELALGVSELQDILTPGRTRQE